MPTGTVQSFDGSTGFGIIKQDESFQFIFVQASNIRSNDKLQTLIVGQKVSYEVTKGPKGNEATGVQFLAAKSSETVIVKEKKRSSIKARPTYVEEVNENEERVRGTRHTASIKGKSGKEARGSGRKSNTEKPAKHPQGPSAAPPRTVMNASRLARSQSYYGRMPVPMSSQYEREPLARSAFYVTSPGPVTPYPISYPSASPSAACMQYATPGLSDSYFHPQIQSRARPLHERFISPDPIQRTASASGVKELTQAYYQSDYVDNLTSISRRSKEMEDVRMLPPPRAEMEHSTLHPLNDAPPFTNVGTRVEMSNGRQSRYYSNNLSSPIYEKGNGDQIRKATGYQEIVIDRPPLNLTTEQLRRSQRKDSHISQGSDSNANSEDDSSWKRSSSSRTTTSTGGHDTDYVTTRLKGGATVTIAGAEIKCDDGAEINVVRRRSIHKGALQSIGGVEPDEQEVRSSRPVSKSGYPNPSTHPWMTTASVPTHDVKSTTRTRLPFKNNPLSDRGYRKGLHSSSPKDDTEGLSQPSLERSSVLFNRVADPDEVEDMLHNSTKEQMTVHRTYGTNEGRGSSGVDREVEAQVRGFYNPNYEKRMPIRFKDAMGRKFSFPFHLCATWAGMEDLIRKAFLHVEVIGPQVVKGRYDLVGPTGETILPQVWEATIKPDWAITMYMWPLLQSRNAIRQEVGAGPSRNNDVELRRNLNVVKLADQSRDATSLHATMKVHATSRRIPIGEQSLPGLEETSTNIQDDDLASLQAAAKTVVQDVGVGLDASKSYPIETAIPGQDMCKYCTFKPFDTANILHHERYCKSNWKRTTEERFRCSYPSCKSEFTRHENLLAHQSKNNHFGSYEFQEQVHPDMASSAVEIAVDDSHGETSVRNAYPFEALEVDDDNESIFSLPESISSKSSLAEFLGPTEEFVILLINHTELPNLYEILCETFEFSSFRSELHLLLKGFCRDLSKEASIPIEKESVRFISQQRKRITHVIGQKVFGVEQQSLFNSNTHEQQIDTKEKVERYLRGAAQIQKRYQDEQALEEDSSGDEEALGTFSNFNHVKKFFVESKAFERLRSSIKNLAGKQEELISTSLQQSNIPELSEKVDADDYTTASNQKVKTQEDFSGVEKRATQASTGVMRYLGEPVEVVIAQSCEQKDDFQDSVGAGILKMVYWKFSRRLRPKVQGGYRRLEWQCDCGAPLYGDFTDSHPGEVDKLGMELQAIGYENKAQESPGIQRLASGQAQTKNSNSPPSTSQGSNITNLTSAASNSIRALLPTHNPANPGVHTAIMPVSPPLPSTMKFTALCVNTGEFNKSLGEIDISSVVTDRQMFHKLKETYHALRGFRAKAIRWFLIKPVDIKFIQFAVEDSHRVDVIPQPPDCTLCASDEDVRSRGYEPHLHTFARTHPPISADAFLHYWQCHSKERSLQRSKWLNRLPKRLDKRLEDVRRACPTDDDVLGWGIHVIEGVNTALVTLLTFFMLLLTGGISVGFSIWKNDVSGGFAIGAYLVALWAAFLTALYFQWKRE